VYFVGGADGTRVKVDGHLAENTASKLIGVTPPLFAGKRRLEVRARYGGIG
jgi:hypothetical protein